MGVPLAGVRMAVSESKRNWQGPWVSGDPFSSRYWNFPEAGIF